MMLIKNSLQKLEELTNSLVSMEDQIEIVLNQALILFAVATDDGRLTKLSNSFEKLLGYTAEEFSARPFLEFVHPDDRARTEQAWIDVKNGATINKFVNRYVAKDGSVKTLLWNGRAKTSSGYSYSVAVDITDVEVPHDRR